MIRTLDLFAGIGGFSLGLHRTGGFETVAFVERDDYASKVLAKNFKGVPIYDDVRTFDADGLGRIDCVTGGHPCQPFSVAGKRLGKEDDRHLWPEMLRIVVATRPRWVIAENVAGHINMGLDQVLSDLEGEGYTSVPIVLPACAVDAPHRRDRVFIISHTDSFDGRRGEKPQQPQRNTPRQPISDSREYVAHTDSHRPQRVGPELNNVEQVGLCGGEASRGEGGGFSKSRLGGMGDGFSHWLVEPNIPRVGVGIKNRAARLKCLGNAVVPKVVQQIGLAILEAEHEFTT